MPPIDEPRIFHVGFPKTGTTWVQTVVVPALRLVGAVEYALGQSEKGPAKWQVAAMHKAARGVILPEERQKLRIEFDHDSYFISAETWMGDSSLSHEARAEALAELMTHKTTILITARPLEGLLNSLFQEQLKSRLYASEEEFFSSQKTRYHAPRWHIEHLSLLDAIKAYRGKFDRVVVVDQNKLSGLDWLAELGFADSTIDLIREAAADQRARGNSSLGPLAVKFLLRINKLISLLALIADQKADARTSFSLLPNREKARELPARIAIVAKVKFLVPLLQRMSQNRAIRLASAHSLAERMGSTWQWEEIEAYAQMVGGITVLR